MSTVIHSGLSKKKKRNQYPLSQLLKQAEKTETGLQMTNAWKKWLVIGIDTLTACQYSGLR